MQSITATELARNLRQVLDRLAVEQSEIVIERNYQPVGRLLPGAGRVEVVKDPAVKQRRQIALDVDFLVQ